MIHEYIEKRVPDIRNEDERDAVATYLFLNSMLPGSGEYCLSRFLNPYGFGRNPTENRIPYLKISHVSFLYGENDWMDVEGGLNVQTLCEEQSDRQAPSIDVFQVKNAGHLLMLDNWREFNVGMALSAGLTPKCDEARPIKLVPGQFVRGENEIETMTHRSPSTNTPI
jgi:cardiolipin-specific phospholipase